ncbi:hypothetical protein DFH09DRAFT_1089782 [Mycena vulgaris]|nr:hypothetical protein DFH09DRAFT_1089782 [Mycena vulgaris]
MCSSSASPCRISLDVLSRAEFQCPQEDEEGSRLTGHGTGVGVSASSNSNGSSGQQIFICRYDDGAGDCVYLSDGSLSLGSSTCPIVSAPDSTTSTPVATTTTEIATVTQTVRTSITPDPPPPTSTSSPSNTAPTASSTSSLASTTSSSTSSTPFLRSSSSVEPDISTHTTSHPTATQSAASSSKKPLPAGTIVGATLGALALVVLGIALCLLIRKSRRKKRMDLEPTSYLTVANQVHASIAPARATTGAWTSPLAENRQRYLTAQLRAVQKELESLQGSGASGGADLEEARQQNETLRARIRTLERDLQSQWAMGLSDHAPPEYQD